MGRHRPGRAKGQSAGSASRSGSQTGRAPSGSAPPRGCRDCVEKTCDACRDAGSARWGRSSSWRPAESGSACDGACSWCGEKRAWIGANQLEPTAPGSARAPRSSGARSSGQAVDGLLRWPRRRRRRPLQSQSGWSGSRVLSSGNKLKSRSHVNRTSVPQAMQMAAILASCTTRPLTRGRRAILSNTARKPSVSESIFTDGEQAHAFNCLHAASRSIDSLPQKRAFVTTLRNSEQTGQGIAQGASPSANVCSNRAAARCLLDSRRWAYTSTLVSTAINVIRHPRKLRPATPARSTSPMGRDGFPIRRSGPAIGSEVAGYWPARRFASLLQPPTAADGPSFFPDFWLGEVARHLYRSWFSCVPIRPIPPYMATTY